MCYYPLIEEYFGLCTYELSAFPYLKYVWYFVIHLRPWDPSGPFDLQLKTWMFLYGFGNLLFIWILWYSSDHVLIHLMDKSKGKWMLFLPTSNACSILWLVYLHTQRLSLRLPYNETFYFMSFTLRFRIVLSYPSHFFNFQNLSLFQKLIFSNFTHFLNKPWLCKVIQK